MPHYSCRQCNYTVAIPICPSCNNFLTTDVAEAEACMKPLAAPPGPVDWCTAFGHWGDVFMCCGLMRAHMERTGQATVNVLYVGPDLAIVDWLELQPFVGDVIGVPSNKAADEEFYKRFWGATTKPDAEPEDWLYVLRQARRDLPKPSQITETHINARWFETRTGLPAQLWHDAVLPEEAQRSAGELMQECLPRRPASLYHLHPVSTWSAGHGEHWAHWLAAIEWLTEKTPHTYVLTGLERIPFLPTSPRLVNLIGKTESNLEVLAISGFCDGVISTPNSIAHWSVIARQKALVVGNLATQHLTSYYRRFLERGAECTYLNCDTPFSVFQGAACEFLEP